MFKHIWIRNILDDLLFSLEEDALGADVNSTIAGDYFYLRLAMGQPMAIFTTLED